MSLLPLVALLPYVLGVQRTRPAACYRPLPYDSIRLLRIHPGSLGSPIICSFEEGSLYTAVSYVWGDKDDTLPIKVSGHTIHVTRNCHAVLRHLRKDNKSTLYWIDAICINQKSRSEKTAQVRRMRETFAQASHVICWLGEEQSTDRKGIQQLMAKHRRKGRAAHDSNWEDMDTGGPELWSIYTRPWFRRVWIVQEFFVARSYSFRIGDLTLDSNALFEVSEYLFTDLYENKITPFTTWKKGLFNGCRDLKTWKRIYNQNGNTTPLSNLFSSTREFECSDERDSIFAMIALDKSVPNSLIDYEKTFEESKNSIFEYYKVTGYERESLEYEWWTNLDTRYQNRKR